MATKKKAMKKKATVKKATKKKTTVKKAAKPVSQEAMMAAWQKVMAPSEGHARLEPIVGSWKTKTTFTMEPGGPPDSSEGTAQHRWVVGGRFVEQVYNGMAMGMPFEGLGFTGYDNIQKKYIGVWMDSFGTGIMHSVGVGKPKPNEMNFFATALDPMKKVMSFDCKVKIKDRDHHTYEMWTKAPNGRKYRTMIVEYTRA